MIILPFITNRIWIAGGAAYYFAKQSINADRQMRYDADQKRRRMAEALEYSETNNQPQPISTKSPLTARTTDNLNGGPLRMTTLDPLVKRQLQTQPQPDMPRKVKVNEWEKRANMKQVSLTEQGRAIDLAKGLPT